jgi:hypothetical protein
LTILIVGTLVKCVNDKGEGVLRVARKRADEVKEERAFHQLWSKVWVVAKVFCYNGSKRGRDHGEFVDESWEDIIGLAQILVVSLAKKGSNKVVSLVKVCTDRMG